MSPVQVTWRRTIGLARCQYATAFAVAGFQAAVSALFAFNLNSAEGGRLSLVAVWAVSVSSVLPVLAAVLAMDVWSGERQGGRLPLLLTAPVRERDLVIGKFIGVWFLSEVTMAVSLFVSLVDLWLVAPEALAGVRLLGFVPGFVLLSLQGGLWCAISVMMSAMFRHGAIAALASVGLTVALPRGGWAALMAWAPAGRPAFGEMPLDAHALDFASGSVSPGVSLSYLLLTFMALFATSKAVLMMRLVGRGAFRLRWSTLTAIILALVFSVLSVLTLLRVDAVVDLPLGGDRAFSPRTRQILSESDGELRVTAYLPRNDAEFRAIGHFLRLLKREAEVAGGVRLSLDFVDPRWDFGPSERLVRLGVAESSIVFEKGRRLVALPIREGYGERLCASVIQRLTAPPRRRNVYWTDGHGECAFDGYGPFGMSDIARDLSREGYCNVRIDLTGGAQIPSDCAFVVVAGARREFSRVELDGLDAYLRQGGRLLTLMNEVEQCGVASLLPTWGLRPSPAAFSGVRTLSGSDVVVSDFSDHAITSALKGSRIVLERPVAFLPSAVVGSGAGADSVSFTPLAKVGDLAVSAAVERGVGTGRDLAIRPTRIVAVGDASFVLNGPLASRANSNRDFFMNCVAYLAGADVSNQSSAEADILVTGLDRSGRVRLLIHLAVGFPLVVLLTLAAVTFARRRRS